MADDEALDNYRREVDRIRAERDALRRTVDNVRAECDRWANNPTATTYASLSGYLRAILDAPDFTAIDDIADRHRGVLDRLAEDD